MIRTYLTFSGTDILFPKRPVQFCIPINNLWECQFLYILVSTWYCQSFNFSHSSGCVVVSHCCFECPWMTSDFEHLFMCLLAFTICIVFLWSVCSDTLPTFIGLIFLSLSCENSLYILDTNSLSDTCFANKFSPGVYLAFHFLKCVFQKAKFLVLIKSV